MRPEKPVDEIEKRIRQAIEHRNAAWTIRSTDAWTDMAERNLFYVKGIQHPAMLNGVETDIVVNNCIKPSIEIMVEALCSDRTRMIGLGRYDQEYEQIARQSAAVVNHEIEVLRLGTTNEKVLWDDFQLGFGAELIGWEFDQGGSDEKVAQQEAELGLPAGKFVEESDGKVTHQSTDYETGEAMVNEVRSPGRKLRRVATKDRPFCDHIPAIDVFFDPIETSPRELKKSRFIVWREYLPIDVVRDDKRNKNTDDLSKVSPDDRYLAEWRCMGADAVEVVEVWYYVGEDPKDKKNKVLTVRVDEGKTELRTVDWPWGYLPMHIYASKNPIDGLTYPDPTVSDCIPHQDVINRAETDRQQQRQASDPLVFADASVVTEEVIDKLRENSTGKIIRVKKSSQVNWDHVFKEFGPPTINPEMYASIQTAQQAIRDITGVTEYMLGRQPERRITATATNTIAQMAGIRPRAIAAKWRDFKRERGRRLLEVIKDNAEQNEPRPYMILTKEGRKAFQSYLVGDLMGDYELDLEVVEDSFTQPLEQAGKMMQFLQVFLQVWQAGLVNPQIGSAPLANPATGKPYWVNPLPLLRQIAYAFGIDEPEQLETDLAATMQPGQVQNPLVAQAGAPPPPGLEALFAGMTGPGGQGAQNG